MTILRLAIASLFSTATAAAEPAPDSGCKVEVARASEDVRATIEQWLSGERCTVPLEVRVVPTEGGLYLFARDGRGRVRERVVPDAQSAGVLVASWAADDGTGPQPNIPAPAAAPEPLALAPPADVTPLSRPARHRRGWVALAALNRVGWTGARATIDLVRSERWTLGVSAALHATRAPNDNWDTAPVPLVEVDLIDGRSFGYLAHTFGDGGWAIRPSLGLGVMYTRASFESMEGSGWNPVYVHHVSGDLSPAAEVALFLGHDLGASWGFDVGAVLTKFQQTMELPDNVTVSRDGSFQLAVQVRYRL